jgi:hypothetical protein
VTYVEGAIPVALAPAAVVTNANAAQAFRGATVTLTGAQSGDRLMVSTTGTGVTASFANNTLTLTGSAPLATYQALLRAVKFDSLQNPTGGSTRTATFALIDQDDLTASASGTITIRELQLVPSPSNVTIVPEDIGGQVGVLEVTNTGELRDFRFKSDALVDGVTSDVSPLITGNSNVLVRVVFLSHPVNDVGATHGTLLRVNGATETPVVPTAAAPLMLTFNELSSGMLKFLPLPDEYGVRYSQLTYRIDVLNAAQPSIVLATSNDATLYFAVRNVNDAPVAGTAPAVAVLQGQSHRLDRDPLVFEQAVEDRGVLT